MLFEVLWRMQRSRNHHCHGENPCTSLAWKHQLFRRLRPWGLQWVTWDQRATGLRHPDPSDGRSHQKRTTLATTSTAVRTHLEPRTCKCTRPHAVLQGTWRGRSLTSYAESYNSQLCRLLAKAFMVESASAYVSEEAAPAKRMRTKGPEKPSEVPAEIVNMLEHVPTEVLQSGGWHLHKGPEDNTYQDVLFQVLLDTKTIVVPPGFAWLKRGILAWPALDAQPICLEKPCHFQNQQNALNKDLGKAYPRILCLYTERRDLGARTFSARVPAGSDQIYARACRARQQR